MKLGSRACRAQRGWHRAHPRRFIDSNRIVLPSTIERQSVNFEKIRRYSTPAVAPDGCESAIAAVERASRDYLKLEGADVTSGGLETADATLVRNIGSFTDV